MGKVHDMDFMQLIKKANKEQEIYEDFELELYGKICKLRISMPDIFDILEEQQLEQSRAFAKCCEKGLDQYEPDLKKWEKKLSEIKDPEARATMAKEPPLTLAHQQAEDVARMATIRTLLPKIIRYVDNGELLCKTSDDQKFVGRYMANNSKALALITEAWAKIMTRYSSVQDTIKNSSMESKDQNTDSK